VATFLGTLLIFILCCLAMGIGLLLRGRPLAGGCGSKLPGSVRCANCPHRGSHAEHDTDLEGKQ
jgi:hypothetical protein